MTQTYPARIVVDADLSCEAPFYTRGARDSEGAQVLHHWARGSDSRGHGDSQARRQERDTMTHRSVRTEVLIFFWAGNPAPFIFFGYVSTKEPVAQMVARITVSKTLCETRTAEPAGLALRDLPHLFSTTRRIN
ncbi:unnamed protein product [Penicillium salamii]|nr:unnamed protein product [Penicillium salamii]